MQNDNLGDLSNAYFKQDEIALHDSPIYSEILYKSGKNNLIGSYY